MRKKKYEYQCSINGCRKILNISKSEVSEAEDNQASDGYEDEESVFKIFYPRVFQ